LKTKNVTLDDNDIVILLSSNEKSGSLIEDTFTNVFFERDQARFLDNFRANINLLDNEYKKSLALTVMNRALTRKVLLGHFAHLSALRYSKDPQRVKRNPTIVRPLKDLFLELVPEYNNAVFDNEKDNEVYCEDTINLLPKLKNVDLVYFDPPYYGCHPDYQAFYHFWKPLLSIGKIKSLSMGQGSIFPKKKVALFVKKKRLILSKNYFPRARISRIGSFLTTARAIPKRRP